MPSPSATLHHLYVPEDRVFEVQILLSLPTDKLVSAKTALRSSSLESLRRDAEPTIDRIASAAKLSWAQALAVWTAVSNLSRQRSTHKISDGDFLDDIEKLVPVGATLDDAAKKALLELCSETEDGYLVEKAQFLRTGFVPSLVAARSICEIRPLFDRKREKIEGAALVAMLGLTTHDDQHDTKTIVIQATRMRLAELKKCIEEAEQKLALMDKTLGDKVELF